MTVHPPTPPSWPKQSQAERNRSVYAIARVVDGYRAREDLFAAEAAILALLKPGLATMSTLDIGVGGGRTAAHLLEITGDYVGIDYCEPMVEACRRRFPHSRDRFRVGDVRRLDLPSRQFHLTLFSYNGLDTLPHAERLAALREMHRVAVPGSWLVLSSHNLHAAGRMPAPGTGPWAALKNWAIQRLVALLNGGLEAKRAGDFAVIRDGACKFRLRNYYIRPLAAARQLEDAGFGDVRVFAMDGREVTPLAAESLPDAWFYYLARAQKRV